MSGNYQRWLLAKGNVLSPGPAALAKLIERLRKEKWIPASGGQAMRTVDKADAAKAIEDLPKDITADWIAGAPEREEMRLVWNVKGDAGGLEYPLSMKPEGTVSYTIELHRAPEFVYPVADNIEMIDTTCNCDEDLAFDWDEDEVVPAFKSSVGIFAECEECSRTFDPAQETAAITNPFDEDDDEDVRGGAAYRFALKVDCGKSFVEDAKLTFAKPLLALFEEEFGRSFYEVGAKY